MAARYSRLGTEETGVHAQRPQSFQPFRKCRRITGAYFRRLRGCLCGRITRYVIVLCLFFVVVSAIYSALDAEQNLGQGSEKDDIFRYENILKIQQEGSVPMCFAPRILSRNTSALKNESIPVTPCSEKYEPLLSMENNVIRVNSSHRWAKDLESCEFKAIGLQEDNVVAYSESEKLSKNEIQIRVMHDFLLAKCLIKFSHNSTVITHEQYIVQTFPKPTVFERIKKQVSKMGQRRRPDVLILLLGDIKAHTRRERLPLTSRYLDSALHPLPLVGLTAIGPGTSNVVVPLLTGKHKEELRKQLKSGQNENGADIFNFLWYDYEKHGYATLFAEDVADGAVFGGDLKGFDKEPTDHYMRPFWLNAKDSGRCLKGHYRHEYTFGYMRDFFFDYANVSKFAAYVHHEQQEGNLRIEDMDEALAEFLATLHVAQFTENLVILLLGTASRDIDLDPSSVSREEVLRQNLIYGEIVLPKWFRKGHKDLGRNLIKNNASLTTPFDLYMTLKDILQVTDKEVDVDLTKDEHAFSLLRPFPRNKSCENSNVPVSWCTCQRVNPIATWKTNSDIVKATKTFVLGLNGLTKRRRHNCPLIKDYDMLFWDIFTPKTKQTFRKRGGPARVQDDPRVTIYFVHLVIKLRPSSTMFSGLVEIHKRTGTIRLLPESLREKSADQRHCLTHEDDV